MAIVKNDSMTTWTEFITWMQSNLVPTYFQSVAVDENDETLLVCTGANGQPLLGLVMNPDNFAPLKYIIYKSDSSTQEETYPTTTSALMQFQYAAVCANGAILKFSKYDRNTATGNTMLAILITLNNNNKSAIIATRYTSASAENVASYRYTHDVRCVAEGDNPTLSPLEFTPRVQEQTQLIPFATNPASNIVSYTPNAFYLQCGNFYDSPYTTFEMGGVLYMTNGYWAVKDE